MNSPAPWLYLLLSFPSPYPGLTVPPQCSWKSRPAAPHVSFQVLSCLFRPVSPARSMSAFLGASPWWAPSTHYPSQAFLAKTGSPSFLH